MPPARLDREASIVRYRSDWLLKEGEETTRLQQWKADKELGDPEPVILTVLLQLTTVRPDELLARLHAQSKRQKPGSGMGPIFAAPGIMDINHILTTAGVAQLRVGAVFPDRSNLNYLQARGPARSEEIRLLISHMQERVRETHGLELVCRYEYVGA